MKLFACNLLTNTKKTFHFLYLGYQLILSNILLLLQEGKAVLFKPACFATSLTDLSLKTAERKTSSKSASSNFMHEASVGDDLDFHGNTIGVDWRGYFSIPILLLE